MTLRPSGRFVVLEHDHPHLHWDFMLEADGALLTWRLSNPPATGSWEAEKLADHRLVYLDYEGPVSGGRGTVKCWDRGVYTALSATTLLLEGAHWRGRIEMVALDDKRWRFDVSDMR